MLSLRCCAQAFSSCGQRGYISLRGTDFSLRWLALLQSAGSRHLGFSSCSARAPERGLSSCGAWGYLALWDVGSSQTRNQTCVHCISRQILIHCATREVQIINFFKKIENENGCHSWSSCLVPGTVLGMSYVKSYLNITVHRPEKQKGLAPSLITCRFMTTSNVPNIYLVFSSVQRGS